MIKGLLIALLSFVFFKPALADENGVGFWLPGQYASGAALPPSPGFGLNTIAYQYRGKSNTTTSGVNQATSATAQDLLLQPTYSFEQKILGATPSIGVTIGPGNAFTSVSAMYGGVSVYQGNQTTYGMSDIYPVAQLYWSDKDQNHFMGYVMGGVPKGTYNSNNLANIGIGHGAVDVGGAYTYTNRQTFWEASATAGVTNNFKNNTTNYKSGADSHLDWDISKGLTRELAVGIAGYVYYQLTADTGSGNTVGPNKSRVLGIGPEAGYLFTRGDAQMPMTYLNVRAYKEYWAQNRVQGTAIFAVLTLRWGQNNIHTFTPEKSVK
jgi:hypothetical protein